MLKDTMGCHNSKVCESNIPDAPPIKKDLTKIEEVTEPSPKQHQNYKKQNLTIDKDAQQVNQEILESPLFRRMRALTT